MAAGRLPPHHRSRHGPDPDIISLADLRLALRSLSKSRGFALAVIATLALGIGANTALFSAVRGALLRPLPNRDGDRLVIFLVRARADAQQLATTSVRAIRDVDPQALIDKVQMLESVREEGVAPRRVNALLVTSFGALALLIAAVGIAGVLAFSVRSRTAEIGIRMSLGANTGRVQRMVLGEGWVLLALGLALGVAGALTASRLLAKLLFAVTPYDPVTVAVVALLMAAVGTAACWLPAARAAHVQPAVALTSE